MNPFAHLGLELPIEYTPASSSLRQRVREEYVRTQDGKCWHCQAPLNGPPTRKIVQSPIDARLFPDGFFNHPTHLHHNHRTDLTIGAVHARCNAWLWQYKGE